MLPGEGRLNPRDLIKESRDLVKASNGRPRQANLLRATSTAYYALFHALAGSCADLLIGGPGSSRSARAWHQVYRALEHSFCKNACVDHRKISRFPREIQDFANAFVSMQLKRHKADYDPHEIAYKSAVLLDIEIVEEVIARFALAPLADRRAFAAYVLLKARKD